MCIGQPMRIIAIDGIAATAEHDGRSVLVDLSLTPEARVGDWVLEFLGSAREILSEGDAMKIAAALDGLRAVMRGEGPGAAFADLETGGPRLPAHLQAALDAGHSTG